MIMSRSFGSAEIKESVFNLKVNDQWNKVVEWDKFSTVPKVLVFGGKEAALESRAWGAHFQILFNKGYEPTPEHLQTLSPNEKVKVIAVATLPEVPGMFKGLFRSGFRKEAKNMGIVLDFAPGLSQSVGYVEDGKIPLVVMFKKDGSEFSRVKALISDEEKKKEAESLLTTLIQQ